MTTLADDTLTISHPALQSELQKLGGAYANSWMPRVLAEDQCKTLENILSQEFQWLQADVKAEIRGAVAAAGPERIAERFTKLVQNAVAGVLPQMTLSFQRTLRIPDDGRDYPLPAGLGRFPLQPGAAHTERLPREIVSRGGVLMPMYQAEALYVDFDGAYPFAVKVGTGGINALNGEQWKEGLVRDPQGYLVVPDQPWLDGYCVERGVIRQFVATPLGEGKTVEEQLAGTKLRGLQIEAFPVKPKVYFECELVDSLPKSVADVLRDFIKSVMPQPRLQFSMSRSDVCCEAALGLGAGGRMKQEVYEDPWEEEDWDLERACRVWVHLIPAGAWLRIAGQLPPQAPVTAAQYEAAGIPWFDYYRDDLPAIKGGGLMRTLRSLAAFGGKSAKEQSMSVKRVRPVGPHAPLDAIGEWTW